MNKKPIAVGIATFAIILVVGLYMHNTSAFAEDSEDSDKNQPHISPDSKIMHTPDGKKIPKHDCGTDNSDCGSDD